MKKLLEVKDLKTYFYTMGETVKAVDGVSFDVYEGETSDWLENPAAGKARPAVQFSGSLKSRVK